MIQINYIFTYFRRKYGLSPCCLPPRSRAGCPLPSLRWLSALSRVRVSVVYGQECFVLPLVYGCVLSTAYAQSFPSNGWRALLLLLSWCPWCRAGGGGLNRLVGFGGDQELIHVTLVCHFGGGQMGSPAGSRSSGKVTDAACWLEFPHGGQWGLL